MAKNKISKTKHLGNVPGDGWKIIGVTEEIYDTEWIVFAFSVTVGKWTNLKIIAKKPTQIKAN